MIIEIFVFLLAYSFDLGSALLHRKLKPLNFKHYESNIMFKNCIEKYGVVEGIVKYIILNITGSIVLFIAIPLSCIYYFKSTYYVGAEYTFVLLICFHLLASITNFISIIFKKEVKEKKVKSLQRVGK